MNGVPGHSYVMNGEPGSTMVILSVCPGVPVKTRDWQWNLYTYFSGNLNKVRSQTVEKYTIDSYLKRNCIGRWRWSVVFILIVSWALILRTASLYLMIMQIAFTGRPGIGRYCSDDYGKKRATGSDFYR